MRCWTTQLFGSFVGLRCSRLRTSSLSFLVLPAEVRPALRKARVWWKSVSAFTASSVFAFEVAEAENFTVADLRVWTMDWRLAKDH
jgi:hypothetical protein